ncbi:MAG: hypothetical protein MUW57_01310 [Pseudomonas sp.]|nr:hypothetical protein [Pseudomonas sp.]
MNPSSWMDSLRKIDLSELDLNNIGSWPNAVKVISPAAAAGTDSGPGLQLSHFRPGSAVAAAGRPGDYAQGAVLHKARQAANLETYPSR